MQKIAVKKSASEAMAKHTDAECLAKSAFAQIRGTEKLPNDVIGTQDDAQAMQRGCRFPQLEVSPPTFHCPGCICKIAALSGFWQDPDPETAAWAQWMLRRYSPARAAAVARQPRPGLPPSRLFAALRPDQTAPEGYLEWQLKQLIDEDVDEPRTPASLLSCLLLQSSQPALPGLEARPFLALPEC